MCRAGALGLQTLHSGPTGSALCSCCAARTQCSCCHLWASCAGTRRFLRTVARTSGKSPAVAHGLGYRPLATSVVEDVAINEPYPERDRLLFGSLHLVGGALLHTTRLPVDISGCSTEYGKLNFNCQRSGTPSAV
jgi:hypothetical protein